MNGPLYKFVDGRAVVVDWAWLKSHTYKELCDFLTELNEKHAENDGTEE